MASFKSIIDAAEAAKKEADILFAKGFYDLAIETYDRALEGMSTIRGAPFGEPLVYKCFANQSQCYLKLNSYDKALQACNIGLSVPSVGHDAHMLSKLWFRKSIAMQALGRLEESLITLDLTFSLGISIPGSDDMRTKLVNDIAGLDSIVAIPPKPVPLADSVLDNLMEQIMLSQGDPKVLVPLIEEASSLRAWMDKCNSSGENLILQLCRVALQRAGSPSQDPDFILPALFALFQSRARAEQRYERNGNRTPLQMLSLAGALECIRLAIQFGAGVRTCDDEGWTPLMVACSPNGPFAGKNAAVIKLLIESASDINHRTKSGLTPLMAACQSNDLESVVILISGGAKLEIRDTMGFSCITWAKIGSPIGNSLVIKAVLDTIVEKNNAALFDELNEDILCFDISLLLQAMNSCFEESKVEVLQKMESHDGRIIEAPTARRHVEKKLVATLRAALRMDVVTLDERHLLQAFHQRIGRLLPNLFSKKWTPKNEKSSFLESFMASSQLEKSWLNIVTAALRGPAEVGSPPPLVTRRHLDFYYLRLYEEFRVLIQDPLSRLYSGAIPSDDAIAEITSTRKRIVEVRLATPASNLDSEEDSSGETFYANNYWQTILSSEAIVEAVELQLKKEEIPDSGNHSISFTWSFPDEFTLSLNDPSVVLAVTSHLVPPQLCMHENFMNDSNAANDLQSLSDLVLSGFVSNSNVETVYLVAPRSDPDNFPAISVEDVMTVRLGQLLIQKFSNAFVVVRELEIPSWNWTKNVLYTFVRK